MADRWILKEITIKGVRGFVEPKTFLTSEPFMLFDGPQGSGKSSILVAIEWAMFGKEIAKKGIGIDERRGMKIRNTNSDEARVEMVLERGENVLKIVRSDKRKGGRPGFYFEMNGNENTDEGELRALLGIQPKDYFSSVHLHQETIRALLIQTPQTRKDSLDRLLGLSDLRNMVEGIKSAKISGVLKDVNGKFELIETSLNAIITAKQTAIKEEKNKGFQKGLTSDDFVETGAQEMCEKAQTKLLDFANQAGLTPPDLPSASTLDEQQNFASLAKQSLRKLRAEQPDLKRQKALLKKQGQLQKFQQIYEGILGDLKEKQQERNRILKAEGNQSKIKDRIATHLKPKLKDAKNHRNEIDKRAGTIEEAIKYFQVAKTSAQGQFCPVCEKPIDDVTHLHMHLKDLRADLDTDLTPIRQEIKEYEQEIKRLKSLIKTLNDLDDEITKLSKQLKEKKSAIEAVLGHEIGKKEDPLAIMIGELEQIEKNLEEVKDAVEESNEKLNDIEDDIGKLKQILKVLVLKKEIGDLLKINKTNEYKAVENSKLELEKFAAGLDLIHQVIERRIQKSARAKLKAAKDSIANMFQALTDRPDFSEIEIDPKSFEILAVSGNETIPALSIFNQGDLNCAGLSVFLGLGATQEVSHNLDFIILDDPSQSLDSTHKKNLVSILNSIPGNKQILVSTSESDLRDLMLSKITRKKRRYSFAPWSDIKGAQPKEM